MAGDQRNLCYREVLPVTTMVAIECINVGLNTLYKAATLEGMSYHVFMVYCYAVAALILLPAPFFSFRSRRLPPLTWSILSKFFLWALIGWTSQVLGFVGIIYSSPTLSSAISNLVPGFTFILGVVFGMETLCFSKLTTRAKVLGTIVSMAGALVVTLYKGPKVISNLSHSPSLDPLVSLSYSQDDWALGGILFTSEYILAALWYILQVQILKEYPAELTMVFFYSLVVCILSAIMGVFMEPNTSVWKIKPDIALASILCSGVLSSVLKNTVHAWALHIKGALFVAMFKPLSIAIAVVMGVLFLGDNLYIGSVIGAIIISVGFYTVMWAKGKEDAVKDENINSESLSPFLQYYKDGDMESRQNKTSQ